MRLAEMWRLKMPEGAGEIRCPNCGNAHKNPTLKSTYRVCHHCFFILEQTTALDMGHPLWLKESGKLRILAATYGHPAGPRTGASLSLQLVCFAIT